MNKTKWIKNKIAAKVQSAVLVVSLALLLGLMGQLIGGNQLAFMLIAGVVILYLLSPIMSPALFLKFNSGRRLSAVEAPRLYAILQGLAQKAELTRLPVLFYLPTEATLAFTADGFGRWYPDCHRPPGYARIHRQKKEFGACLRFVISAG